MRTKICAFILGFFLSGSVLLSCGGGVSGGDSPSDEPNISVSQTNVDFSGIVLADSEDRTITIKNTGNANLAIGQISTPASPFSILQDNCSGKTLALNQSASIILRFSPTATGEYYKTFSIPSNDPDSPTVSISVKGEGCGLSVKINQVDTSNCPDIYLDFTVIDQEGNLITDLTAADNFHIYINNTERVIEYNENSTRDPLSVVMTLDVSSSLTTRLNEIKAASQDFIADYLTDADEAAICKFKAEIEFFPSISPLFITTDDEGKGALNNYINLSFSLTDGTALYDAIYYSIERASNGSKSKKALILLSDGANNIDDTNETIAYANSMGIPIFSIYYDVTGGVSEVMQNIADVTDGKYYTYTTTEDLEDIFQQIRYVLTDKYTILIPGINCNNESIDIEVRVNSGELTGVAKTTKEL